MILFGLTCGAACTTATKERVPRKIHAISQFVPYNVHFRRTSAKGADPFAGPGGTDYVSEVPPNERFDCEPIARLFRELDLAKIRGCLAGISEGTEIQFHLKREPSPSFVLDENEKTPPCFRNDLPVIPVPREIFFETIEESKGVCYASRLNIEEDELFWVKMPIAKRALRLQLPLSEPPQTDEETILLLFSYAITPFWSGTPRTLPSFYVPDSLCNACIGKKNRVNRSTLPAELWP